MLWDIFLTEYTHELKIEYEHRIIFLHTNSFEFATHEPVTQAWANCIPMTQANISPICSFWQSRIYTEDNHAAWEIVKWFKLG